MKIVMMPVGMLEVNCCIVASEQGNAAVIDPGGEAGRILDYLESNGLTVKKILLTHGHFDHIGGVKALKDATDAELCIHEADASMLTDAARNMSAVFGTPYAPVAADRLLRDGDSVALDELCFQVIHTPGHTPGSVSYLTGETLFSGDTLFRESIGRTDFPGGDSHEIMESLKKLRGLPGDYTVLSGHGEKTTLSWEREHNPYLRTLE